MPPLLALLLEFLALGVTRGQRAFTILVEDLEPEDGETELSEIERSRT
jgi:hypothetical protein